ncbi:MAG TPA: GNAT family N-acetyltransferase [Gemmatimonadaceae bacterium]|nr:GNAT family N-acetyltransferase [Gemmatimonadaceae bacterium]
MVLTQHTAVSVRIADAAEHDALTALYRSWGYRAGIAPGSIVYAAMRDGQTVGLVRRTIEDETTMLRGMFIDPELRRRGIGEQLLAAFTADLPDVDCLCVPFTHLVSFYGRSGFVVIPESAAPAFLRERLERYRSEGHDMLVMRRPAPAIKKRS